MSLSSIASSAAQSFDAGQAYGRAQQLSQTSSPASAGPADETESTDAVSSFSHVLDNAIRGAINTGKVAESQTAQALSGKGNMSDVVASVEEAKLTLQTVTTLRDRFVSAYQDVMRMSV
ncbi:flagellar hook-basal body complex protein FliE [Parasaccharibacter sp. TMW2.1882]|uniref:Flagellar hook-basal body complex protein FliE n=2 Tax=Acetobacteraceae TaxID=433 RepID=A0A7U7G4N9_9PROT|nr:MULTISPECIES: flagellar hook-basal body complex protein FliE [Acetobacteraceae]MCL1562392.1 flagellar hook-basal body complex protein FliE [Parasaccharibacter sp. TMW 2.1886]MCQ0040891.1 flagellar hook-basal body complex protein FliE [Bombella sp.]MUG79911.1 flagellar hook-basal body complex protein FliE [Bombella sp. ESL0380]MUH03264.1 flagellar hook-basal body complex protein FliE [Bombella sp. ESL0387]QGT75511.1 flagellar hook-basal body complex protein FliE [Bombella sp. ESL0368]